MNAENGKMAILLVEDDDADNEIVEILLKRNNISSPLYRARDGIEALEILKKMMADEKLQKPFLLVIDIYLPRMSGLKFLETVRLDDALKDHRAVILTTSDFMDHRSCAYSLDVAGYILKDRLHELIGFINHGAEVETPSGDTPGIRDERAAAAQS